MILHKSEASMSKKQQLITASFHQQKGPDTRSSKRLEKKTNITTKQDEDIATTSKSRAEILREKELDILQKFDVRMEYGPCTGISRLERWERADKDGLNPPDVIRQLILKHESDQEYTHNLWHDYPL